MMVVKKGLDSFKYLPSLEMFLEEYLMAHLSFTILTVTIRG
jgi:hypothetical protein